MKFELLFLTIILSIIYAKYKNIITIDNKLLIILMAICLAGLLMAREIDKINNIEGFVSNEEALRNLSQLYNSSNLTVTNLKVTGNLDVSGRTVLTNTMSQNLNLSNTLDVSGNAVINSLIVPTTTRLNNWMIRENRIGIPDKGDLYFENKKCGFVNYDSSLQPIPYNSVSDSSLVFVTDNIVAYNSGLFNDMRIRKQNIRSMDMGIDMSFGLWTPTDPLSQPWRIINITGFDASNGGVKSTGFSANRFNASGWKSW